MSDTKPNVITLKPNGPLVCEGDITVISADGEVLLKDSEAYLCRCGASKNTPFCDGAHKDIGFSDAGIVRDNRGEALASEIGPLLITVKPNAMLSVKGPVTIQSQDGTTHTQRNRAALCRCGESNKKPFCDASHKQHGFSDE